MSNKLDLNISNILTQAIAEAEIVGNFQYGHNLLQSPVQIDEIFSMLDTIIQNVLNAIGDVIPDINLAPYQENRIDPTRANLCWIELEENYYGLILNMYHGVKYRPFDADDIKNLLLHGQTSSWYLISKIQTISHILTSNMNDASIVDYFRELIIDIIERFFYDHEHDAAYHPYGMVTMNNLESTFSKFQIQNTTTIPTPNAINLNSSLPLWSQSLIKTQSHEICWQSAPNFKLEKVTPGNAINVISSKYLCERSDVEVFLQETFEKRAGNQSTPNEFCYLSSGKFSVPYVDLNYVVESQLNGYFLVKYTNGEEEKISPNVQPLILEKGKNNISFIVVLKLDNEINKKIESVNAENVKLICSCTGVSKKFNDEI